MNTKMKMKKIINWIRLKLTLKRRRIQRDTYIPPNPPVKEGHLPEDREIPDWKIKAFIEQEKHEAERRSYGMIVAYDKFKEWRSRQDGKE